ncbi:glycoside hydrolase family 97 catalytic domain-containing protein [Pelagicoccus enzymogenes]|uniref:glycoside hydrolase family 97 protein n=1 Tax=Pelagicoccus enzymogenes TaxID=2773457 RepID=UPI00280DA60E|nr:glycoside hydrolase family 97 catalytic domain-containing protein [Pelagicoccus enzymogenes]MDQ8197882.1 glycoside hydrolase family 97 catalytic domain-containing protein [Pelagicoccus enzymogenes]
MISVKKATTLAALCFTCLLAAEKYEIASPNGTAALTLSCEESQLSYSLTWNDQQLIDSSSISIGQAATYEIISTQTIETDETWKPVWGQFSEIRDWHNELTLKVEISGIKTDLICRIFDDGVGIRFSVPAQKTLQEQEVSFDFQYNLAVNSLGYFPAGERMPLGPLPMEEWNFDKNPRNLPAVLGIGEGRYMSLMESDLYSAKPFRAAQLSVDPESSTAYVSVSGKVDSTGFLTPWRIILFADNIGDLIVNTVPINLAAPNELENTSWIKPGKGLWDWRIHGYHNGDFEYKIDTRSYLRLIDFCSSQGIEYLTIDDHWFLEAKSGKMKVSPDVDIEKVMAYADEKSVGIILYYDRKKGNFGDDSLFSHYKNLGASGMKYGFMGNDASFTRNAMNRAAEENLLLFFHDAPTPMTGLYRTLPNSITREYCHAQQDSRRALSPESFLKTAMVNALSGPLDQANGNFGIRSINAGERKKGPRELNTYISTVTSEVARTLVIFSGLITLPDAPEEYLKKSDLFEFIKQLPATWDDTRIVNAEMAKYITTARRSGETWFVGSVNNEESRSLPIDLDFLDPDKTYQATIFSDAPDSHGADNPEAYQIVKRTLQRTDTVHATMAVGGGHAMILKPIENSLTQK